MGPEQAFHAADAAFCVMTQNDLGVRGDGTKTDFVLCICMFVGEEDH